MKKRLLILFLFLLIGILGIYFFIPTRQNLTAVASIKCTESGATRILLNKRKWQKWWPGETSANGSFGYKGYTYKIDKIFLASINATIFNGKDSISGKIDITASEESTIQLLWRSPLVFSTNPITRLAQYSKYASFKDNIQSMLSDAKKFFENEENIYGMKIIKQRISESSMISTKQSLNHYPNTNEIYSMINSVKQYIKIHKGEEDKFPMLNVHTEDSVTFDVMIAVPIKMDLPGEGVFELKKFPIGNMLMGETKGGYLHVINQELEFTNYLKDHNKQAPAIPFQSLVTNRITEPDSSKWITRLYYPVFF